MQLSFYLTSCGHVKVVGNQDKLMPDLADYKIFLIMPMPAKVVQSKFDFKTHNKHANTVIQSN